MGHSATNSHPPFCSLFRSSHPFSRTPHKRTNTTLQLKVPLPIRPSQYILATTQPDEHGSLSKPFFLFRYLPISNTPNATGKMPISNNVEVSAFYHEEPYRLTEYRGLYEDDSKKQVYRYIESTTGKRFVVAVEILKSFDFDLYPFVKIGCCLDGRSVHTRYMGKQRIACSTSTRERQTWFHSASRFVDGQWAECAFTFGDLLKSMYSTVPITTKKISTNSTQVRTSSTRTRN